MTAVLDSKMVIALAERLDPDHERSASVGVDRLTDLRTTARILRAVAAAPGDVYTSAGRPLVFHADRYDVPVPRPPRTDPWGLGLTEEQVRQMARVNWQGAVVAERVGFAACRAVVAEWDAEGEQ